MPQTFTGLHQVLDTEQDFIHGLASLQQYSRTRPDPLLVSINGSYPCLWSWFHVLSI